MTIPRQFVDDLLELGAVTYIVIAAQKNMQRLLERLEKLEEPQMRAVK